VGSRRKVLHFAIPRAASRNFPTQPDRFLPLFLPAAGCANGSNWKAVAQSAWPWRNALSEYGKPRQPRLIMRRVDSGSLYGACALAAQAPTYDVLIAGGRIVGRRRQSVVRGRPSGFRVRHDRCNVRARRDRGRRGRLTLWDAERLNRRTWLHTTHRTATPARGIFESPAAEKPDPPGLSPRSSKVRTGQLATAAESRFFLGQAGGGDALFSVNFGMLVRSGFSIREKVPSAQGS